MRRATHTRPAYTLVEVMAVLVAILVLGVILIPTLSGLSGDTRIKAGADTLRARMADGRALAMEQARPYRLCVHTDGDRIRLAPDRVDFSELPAGGMAPETDGGFPVVVMDDTFPTGVTAHLLADEDTVPQIDSAGWVTVATFLTDGTCREDNAVVEFREVGVRPLLVQLRGLTGATTTMVAPDGGSSMGLGNAVGAKP